MWDFETEPEFQEKLDWIDAFVREEVEPLDLVLGNPYDKSDQRVMRGSSGRCSSRCATRACGRATSAPSSAGRATAS